MLPIVVTGGGCRALLPKCTVPAPCHKRVAPSAAESNDSPAGARATWLQAPRPPVRADRTHSWLTPPFRCGRLVLVLLVAHPTALITHWPGMPPTHGVGRCSRCCKGGCLATLSARRAIHVRTRVADRATCRWGFWAAAGDQQFGFRGAKSNTQTLDCAGGLRPIPHVVQRSTVFSP